MINEQHLNELVTRLKNAAGANLLSVVLYGSAAAGEFHEGHSDVNILCIMKALGAGELSCLHVPSAWWVKKGHPAPLYFALSELHNAADIFTIELLDIVHAHRSLYGEDLITTVEIPLDRHRLQVERELRNNTLRLRQQYLQQPTDSRRTLELMTSSISSFAALYRHALIVLGQDAPANKREVIDRLGTLLGVDLTRFQTILDIREGQKRARDVDVQATFAGYLEGVQLIADEMDRRLATSG